MASQSADRIYPHSGKSTNAITGTLNRFAICSIGLERRSVPTTLDQAEEIHHAAYQNLRLPNFERNVLHQVHSRNRLYLCTKSAAIGVTGTKVMSIP